MIWASSTGFDQFLVPCRFTWRPQILELHPIVPTSISLYRNGRYMWVPSAHLHMDCQRQRPGAVLWGRPRGYHPIHISDELHNVVVHKLGYGSLVHEPICVAQDCHHRYVQRYDGVGFCITSSQIGSLVSRDFGGEPIMELSFGGTGWIWNPGPERQSLMRRERATSQPAAPENIVRLPKPKEITRFAWTLQPALSKSLTLERRSSWRVGAYSKLWRDRRGSTTVIREVAWG